VRVVVTNYNPQWPGMFEAEVDIIRKVFGEELIAVHHILSEVHLCLDLRQNRL
jgi:GrpB-like predicted nucleotidyltransferase (UPF0157 family)